MNCGVFLNAVIKNINSLVKDVYRVLKQKGIFTVSLYNSGALVSQLVNELDWEPSLSVRFTDAKNFLKVVFQGKKFNIAAKTYSVQECRNILSQYFEIVELSTFPTISSVLPNSLFGNPKVKDIFKRIDYKIRFDEKIASGPYICVVCKK